MNPKAVCLLVVLSLPSMASWTGEVRFLRSDTDGNSQVDLTDAVRIFNYLFLGAEASIRCRDAADVDDSGTLNLSDGIVLLNFLFQQGSPPRSPFPDCGVDPTPDDDLGCEDTPARCPTADDLLLDRFAPIVFLHPDDGFRPSSVEWYLDRVSLVVPGGVPDPNFTALEHFEVIATPERLTRHILVGARDSADTQRGEPLDDEGRCVAPCYAYVRRVDTSYVDLNYWFFYPWNGSTVNGLLPLIATDAARSLHDGDWENITVRVDASASRVTKVFLSSHGDLTEFDRSDDRFLDPLTGDELHFRGEQVEVYSARHSHATYPTPGDNFRICIPVLEHCFAVDRRRADGPEWNTRGRLVNIGRPTEPGRTSRGPEVAEMPKWLRFAGKWGGVKTDDELEVPDPENPIELITISGTNSFANGPDGPATKSSWYQNPIVAGHEEIAGVGDVGNGAGMALFDLNGNGRPELILMAYDDAAGENSFRYRVVSELNDDGVGTAVSALHEVPGVGSQAQGAGAAIADLDGNGRPEMFFMAYDNPSGGNTFRYRVGRDLDSSGVTRDWSAYIQVAGVGAEAEGADLVVHDIDGNGRPEMLLMAYDAPGGPNSFRYRVGWNLDPDGEAQRWSEPMEVEGVGDLGNGAGISVFRGSGGLEFVLMAYDAPVGGNSIRCRVGTAINVSTGEASWSPAYEQKAGFGDAGEGAAVILTDLDGNGRPDRIFMVYDDPTGASANAFRYRVEGN